MKKNVDLITKIIYITFRASILLLMIVTIIMVVLDSESRSRNLFVAGQSLLFLLLSFVPSIVEKRFKYEIPSFMELIYICFCAANNILGEIGNFYATISWWDDMLHTISGVLIAIVGFSLINILNRNEKIPVKCSPLFCAIFVVCFAVTIGVVWEVIEFSVDYITGGNMQRYMDSKTHEAFIGQVALYDTMSDLIEAFLGSTFIATLGYIDMSRKKNWFRKWEINEREEREEGVLENGNE